jgi:hypothetical protein
MEAKVDDLAFVNVSVVELKKFFLAERTGMARGPQRRAHREIQKIPCMVVVAKGKKLPKVF